MSNYFDRFSYESDELENPNVTQDTLADSNLGKGEVLPQGNDNLTGDVVQIAPDIDTVEPQVVVTPQDEIEGDVDDSAPVTQTEAIRYTYDSLNFLSSAEAHHRNYAMGGRTNAASGMSQEEYVTERLEALIMSTEGTGEEEAEVANDNKPAGADDVKVSPAVVAVKKEEEDEAAGEKPPSTPDTDSDTAKAVVDQIDDSDAEVDDDGEAAADDIEEDPEGEAAADTADGATPNETTSAESCRHYLAESIVRQIGAGV